MSGNISDILGHTFQDEGFLAEALTHASSADDRLQSNERMEFLGDAVLGYVVCSYLYRNFPELMEGELTKIKSAVVSRKTCATISQQLGLGDMLNLGKGMSGRPVLPDSVWAAVFESVIAAIYLDGGIEAAQRFILKQVRPFIDGMAECSHQDNFKSVLQHYAQKHLPCNPTYVLLDEKGPDHAKAFEVCVEINSRRFSSAWAMNKKQAEQDAALLALRELGLIDVDDDGVVRVRAETGMESES
jgi:ribonuclease-3